MGAGRFCFVALPFGLTLASLICILMTILGGITTKSLDMFEVSVHNLSIAPSALQQLEGLATRSPTPDLSHLTIAGLTGSVDPSVNVTAADLGLSDYYEIYMFNYCSKTGTNTTCSKARFDWASDILNTSMSITSSTGVIVTLPKTVSTSLNTFATVSRWTQIVYLIALGACISELVLGLFAICSRVGSCCTFIVSAFATLSIIVASILGTVQSSLVVGMLDSTTKLYGVHAAINTSFLSVTWLAVAFSLGGSLFWLLSICCCASDHHSSKSSGGGLFGRKNGMVHDGEKMIPTGAYQRVEDSTYYGHGQQSGVYNPQTRQEFGAPAAVASGRSKDGSGAYEPYSHTQV